MKKRFYLAIVLALFTNQASAFSLVWLQPMIEPNTALWQLEQLQDSMELYDCGLEKENQAFCSDVIKYYNVDVESRLLVQSNVVQHIEITAPYSSIAYAELQLNLRKDGYVLAKAVINGREYDAIKALKSKPIKLVNREMVMFINDGPISSSRELTWYPNSEYYAEQPSREAIFSSDKQGIKLTFKRINRP